MSADLIARRWGFTREQLDEFSLESHARVARAQDEGRSDAEIEAVATLDSAGNGVAVTKDEASAVAAQWNRWPSWHRLSAPGA